MKVNYVFVRGRGRSRGRTEAVWLDPPPFRASHDGKHGGSSTSPAPMPSLFDGPPGAETAPTVGTARGAEQLELF